MNRRRTLFVEGVWDRRGGGSVKLKNGIYGTWMGALFVLFGKKNNFPPLPFKCKRFVYSILFIKIFFVAKPLPPFWEEYKISRRLNFEHF